MEIKNYKIVWESLSTVDSSKTVRYIEGEVAKIKITSTYVKLTAYLKDTAEGKHVPKVTTYIIPMGQIKQIYYDG